MHRIDSDLSADQMPPIRPAEKLGGYFQDADPTTGRLGTVISADWLNTVQEEIVGAIEGAGLILDKSNPDQLRQAILSLIELNSVNGNVGGASNRLVRTADEDGNLANATAAELDESDNLGGIASLSVGGTIGDKHPSAIAEFRSTLLGILFPRMTTEERDAIFEPAEGLVIFNLSVQDLQVYRAAMGWAGVADLGLESIYSRLEYLENYVAPSVSTLTFGPVNADYKSYPVTLDFSKPLNLDADLSASSFLTVGCSISSLTKVSESRWTFTVTATDTNSFTIQLTSDTATFPRYSASNAVTKTANYPLRSSVLNPYTGAVLDPNAPAVIGAPNLRNLWEDSEKRIVCIGNPIKWKFIKRKYYRENPDHLIEYRTHYNDSTFWVGLFVSNSEYDFERVSVDGPVQNSNQVLETVLWIYPFESSGFELQERGYRNIVVESDLWVVWEYHNDQQLRSVLDSWSDYPGLCHGIRTLQYGPGPTTISIVPGGTRPYYIKRIRSGDLPDEVTTLRIDSPIAGRYRLRPNPYDDSPFGNYTLHATKSSQIAFIEDYTQDQLGRYFYIEPDSVGADSAMLYDFYMETMVYG